ncbi:tetratricopeptide repeat protein [Nocardia beijingensis]|uniref:tetratricopeptide repeat protein n=1 Tax=Nocardia beijingensis TaxID=95162 RepID=UPI0018953DB9|nr:tetratricopeptide repeat protein [Nocardia beijingensis]
MGTMLKRPPDLAFDLGKMHRRRNDVAAAREAFQIAIASGHPNWAPLAAAELGGLLSAVGDKPAAEGAYHVAVDSGHEDAAPRAAYNLGLLLAERGDTAAAEAMYERAAESGHPDAAPRAWINLGYSRAKRGDSDAARTAYRHAIDAGPGDIARLALSNLAYLLRTEDDLDGVKTAYRAVIDGWPADQSLIVAGDLVQHLGEAGDLAGAREVSRSLAESDDPAVAARASLDVGVFSERLGEPDVALAAFQRALDSTDAEARVRAAAALAPIYHERAATVLRETDWAGLAHADGPAVDAPAMLADLIGQTVEDQVRGIVFLFSAVLHQGSIYSVTAPAAEVVLGALLHERTDVTYARAWVREPQPLRSELLNWLHEVMATAAWQSAAEDEAELTAADRAAAAACLALLPRVRAATSAALAMAEAEAVANAATEVLATLSALPTVSG